MTDIAFFALGYALGTAVTVALIYLGFNYADSREQPRSR